MNFESQSLRLAEHAAFMCRHSDIFNAICDALMLHVSPYLWNLRWNQTNNQRLAKFENSFEVKRLAFLKHPRTRSLLEKTKKLVLVKHYLDPVPNPNMKISTVHIRYFRQCEEEIEIRNFDLQEKPTFDLHYLSVCQFGQAFQ